MSDLQTLPSSLREKKRYLVFEIHSPDDHELGDVVDAIWDAALDLFGEKGVAEAEPWVIKDLFDEDAQRGGMKVNKDMAEQMRAALTLITEIDNTSASLHVLGVTGTMDSAERKFF